MCTNLTNSKSKLIRYSCVKNNWMMNTQNYLERDDDTKIEVKFQKNGVKLSDFSHFALKWTDPKSISYEEDTLKCFSFKFKCKISFDCFNRSTNVLFELLKQSKLPAINYWKSKKKKMTRVSNKFTVLFW